MKLWEEDCRPLCESHHRGTEFCAHKPWEERAWKRVAHTAGSYC